MRVPRPSKRAARLIALWLFRHEAVPAWAARVVTATPRILIFGSFSHGEAARLHAAAPSPFGWLWLARLATIGVEVRWTAADFGDRLPDALAALDAALRQVDLDTDPATTQWKAVLQEWRETLAPTGPVGAR